MYSPDLSDTRCPSHFLPCLFSPYAEQEYFPQMSASLPAFNTQALSNHFMDLRIQHPKALRHHCLRRWILEGKSWALSLSLSVFLFFLFVFSCYCCLFLIFFVLFFPTVPMASLVVRSVFGGILGCGAGGNHTRAFRNPPSQAFPTKLWNLPFKTKIFITCRWTGEAIRGQRNAVLKYVCFEVAIEVIGWITVFQFRIFRWWGWI